MKDPYDKLSRIAKRFEWLWRFIDWLRYGKERKEVKDKYEALRKANVDNIMNTEMVGEDMIGKEIEVAGIKITVQTDAECDKAEWWVCVRRDERYPVSPLDTAVAGECSKCGHAIWYNPRVTLTGPKKICVECMLEVAKGEESLNE